MSQLFDLPVPISENTTLVLRAATCLAIIAAITRIYLSLSKSLSQTRQLPLPPSPPINRRLRGHALPPLKSFPTIAKWIDQHGPLITIRSGTQKIVYIGRHKAAVDIMEKQSKALSDRPRYIAAGEILSGGLSIALVHPGERFRRMRRALHTHLRSKEVENYQSMQIPDARNAVLAILDDPCNFQKHALTFTATTTMKVAYGKTTPTFGTDPEITSVGKRFKALNKAMVPGAYWVESIPWLKYLPWYGGELKRQFETDARLWADQLQLVKEQISDSNSNSGPSLARYLLENNDRYAFSEMEAAFLSGALMLAGTHSTALAICAVLMAAARFPQEQVKVYAEIEAVVGMHRAPTADDVDAKSFPRLHAFISEVHRWRPTVPNGVPHRTTEDVIWENYCIPAGTTVIGHHWSISRDPDVFPEPEAFKPQRWIDEQGHLREDLRSYPFGFGRRACPGQLVAQRTIFMHVLFVLWAFRLCVDPTKPSSKDDMGYMSPVLTDVRQCPIVFQTRIGEGEVRRMMMMRD